MCFWYKNTSKMLKKFSACGGHIIIEIRLVNVPKVYFSAAADQNQYCCVLCLSTDRLYTSIQVRSFVRATAGQNHSVFSFMRVYRTPLHKHKTKTFCPRCGRSQSQSSLVFCMSTGRLYTSIKLRIFVRAAAGQNHSPF